VKAYRNRCAASRRARSPCSAASEAKRGSGLPVKIVAEFDTWRRIEDHEGDQGWVHRSLLSGRRTVVTTAAIRELRRLPDPSARVVLRAEPGVIGRLQLCNGTWCEVEIAGTAGWIARDQIWGVLPGDPGS
jgi:SH3-like domain-containing protein